MIRAKHPRAPRSADDGSGTTTNDMATRVELERVLMVASSSVKRKESAPEPLVATLNVAEMRFV